MLPSPSFNPFLPAGNGTNNSPVTTSLPTITTWKVTVLDKDKLHLKIFQQRLTAEEQDRGNEDEEEDNVQNENGESTSSNLSTTTTPTTPQDINTGKATTAKAATENGELAVSISSTTTATTRTKTPKDFFNLQKESRSGNFLYPTYSSWRLTKVTCH